MNRNPNGKLAVYANINGIYYGERIVTELNNIIRDENKKAGEVVEEEIKLKVPKVTEFPNSMLKVTLEERVRGEDAFLVQWFPQPPGADSLKYRATRNKEEFFQTIGALFQAGVKKINLVTPYAYDQRKDTLEGRDTIGAALFCQELGGVTHNERMQAFCLDIHAQQIVGYYQLININMVSVPMFKTYVDFIKENYPEILENAVIVLPDTGSSKRGRTFSELTGLPRITLDKRRVSPTETVIEAFSAGGVEIKGKEALLVDDILGTGSTAGDGISYLMTRGLTGAYWLMTHPELTNLNKLDEMYEKGLFKKIFIADTIASPRDYLIQVPTSKLTGRLIYNVHTDQSIGHHLKN